VISRRKFLQGALGFASAAILPAGVIMPIKGEKIYIKEWRWGWPAVMRVEPFNFYPNPEDDGSQYIYGSDLDSERRYDQFYDDIIKAREAMDAADVPQTDRIIWLPQQGIYIDNFGWETT